MSMELAPGEQQMAKRASADAQALANLLLPPVSGQHIHDAERHLKHVAAAIAYLKDRLLTAEAQRRRVKYPSHD